MNSTAIAILIVVLSGIISYLLGSINLSIIISNLIGKGDIREYGSKNAGTTNTLRVLGKGPALLVFIWDILKGVLAVFFARWITSKILGSNTDLFNYTYIASIMISSLCVILGHNYPAFFGFKGGKGVATSLGVILAIEWRIGLVCLAVGLVGIGIFQMVSVGSLIAAIEYPILVIVMGGHFDELFNVNKKIRLIYIVFSFVLSLMVLFRHKANIERIRNGTESKLKFKKTPEEKIQEEKENLGIIQEEKNDSNEQETKEEIAEKVEEVKVNEPVKKGKKKSK